MKTTITRDSKNAITQRNQLMKLAVDYSNNQKNEDRDNRNSNYPIRSHPIQRLASTTSCVVGS